MTPLQYKTFYVLAADGSTPAAKVVVLAGQLDKIDTSKLTVSVESSHNIVGYDTDTGSDAMENCLGINISSDAAVKFFVTKVCFHLHKPKLAGCLLLDLTCCPFVLCVRSVQEMCHRSRDPGLWIG